MNNNRKVLITGGAGFIGLHFAKHLLSKGYFVDLVDNYSRGSNDQELNRVKLIDRAKFIEIDLLDEKQVMMLGNGYNYVIHLAAIIGVSHVLSKPYSVLYDNVAMLGNIINLANKQHSLKRVMFTSTSEVYAGTLKFFDMKIPTPEKTPLAVTELSHPRTSYMLSKIYGEAMLCQSGLPYTILRPHNVYGARMGMSHVIPEQLKKAHNANLNEYVDVYSVDHTRSFCYIDDAVNMMGMIMESTECMNKILNIGNQDEEVTMLQVSLICHEVVRKKLSIREKEASPGSPVRRCPDMFLTQKLTDYIPVTKLSVGIKKTYEWYKQHYFEC